MRKGVIDDVRNLASKMDAKEESNFGKLKYSIPIFLENGYEIIMDSLFTYRDEIEGKVGIGRLPNYLQYIFR